MPISFSNSKDPLLESVIEKLPALQNREVVVKPLAGGLTNRNYRVECDGEIYVLRIAGEESALLGIRREQELTACRAAAQAGIGAEIIDSIPHPFTLLTRFVPGRVLSETDIQ